MISLLLLAITLFIAAIMLMINAFILWDSENVVRSISPNIVTTHINMWAIISLILAIFLVVISLWAFWEYFKQTTEKSNLHNPTVKVTTSTLKI